MSTVKDHYIRALEYAESHSTFTLEELAVSLGLTSKQKELLALQIHQKQIFNQDNNDYINNYKSGTTDKTKAIELHFSVEDKFKLLNYTALQEARESSKSATSFATLALVISIISLIVSASLSYMQLNSPINIPTAFIEKIDQLSQRQADTNRAISDLTRATLLQQEQKKINLSPPH